MELCRSDQPCVRPVPRYNRPLGVRFGRHVLTARLQALSSGSAKSARLDRVAVRPRESLEKVRTVASPFSIFRKYQRVGMAILAIGAMFLFTFDIVIYNWRNRSMSGGAPVPSPSSRRSEIFPVPTSAI